MKLYNQPKNIVAFDQENLPKLLNVLTEHQRVIEKIFQDLENLIKELKAKGVID